ncbi:hypothetical protein [Delftia sp. PS-11]|nr:hypothetical protein [Delftia sp. PS-11]KAJ8745209.1 hypothetical protein H9T68_08645 [Delftia sp. PS-11]
MKDHTTRMLRRVASWAAACLVLGLVFMLYLQPQFMMGMANQLWACF